MKLIGERDGDVVVFGEGFNFDSAVYFISENEFLHDYHDDQFDPWMEGYDLILIDGDDRWVYDGDGGWLEK